MVSWTLRAANEPRRLAHILSTTNAKQDASLLNTVRQMAGFTALYFQKNFLTFEYKAVDKVEIVW